MSSSYPSYQDFGKSTKDFFTKGFLVGNIKLNVRSSPTKFVNTTMSGSHDMEKMEAKGDFQCKASCPVLPGVSSITKWDTKNVITQEIQTKDKLLEGLDLGLEGTFNGDSGSIAGKLKSMFKHKFFTINGVVEGGDSSNPLVGGGIVTGHKDFAAGYQFELDATETALKKNNVSLAYVKGPISFLTTLDNAELLWSGVIYRHTKDFEGGLNVTYKSDPEGYSVFGTSVKYIMDCCNAFKLKVDSDMQIGLGFETKIRPTSTITMSAQIDGNKLSEGGHKVGLSFDLEC